MTHSFSKVKEHNKNKARELDDSWHRFVSTSRTNLLNSFYGVNNGEMIPDYWYNSEGTIVEDLIWK